MINQRLIALKECSFFLLFSIRPSSKIHCYTVFLLLLFLILKTTKKRNPQKGVERKHSFCLLFHPPLIYLLTASIFLNSLFYSFSLFSMYNNIHYYNANYYSEFSTIFFILCNFPDHKL